MDDTDWNDADEFESPDPDCASNGSRRRLAWHIIEQIMQGTWPVSVPLLLEIYAEGSETQVHPLWHNERRRRADSHVIELNLLFDREKIRDMMLEQFHNPRDPAGSRLLDLMPLARVDRACFLATSSAHFTALLAANDDPLRRDSWLIVFLQELHDVDTTLITELILRTLAASNAAGMRLRDVILNAIHDPQGREALGWLASAAIAQSVQDVCGEGG